MEPLYIEEIKQKRSISIASITKALSQFQGEVENPTLNKSNPHFKSKYADLSEVLNTVRPILTKYGLSIYQNVGTNGDSVTITTTIFHESGEWIESNTMTIPAGRGGKSADAQGIGSAASYGKRYQIQAVLGITAEEDDDGEAVRGNYQAPKPKMDTKAQPSQAQLAAKYQLVMGSRDGFDEYVQKLKGQGKDESYIMDALDRAFEKKKEQQ